MEAEKLKKRHEWWREAYRANRYARHLTRDELNARIQDVVRNLIELSPGALTGLVPMDEDGDRWMQRWTHLLEEMQSRFGPYPMGFSRDILAGDPLPDFSGEAAKRALAAGTAAASSGALFKFGTRKYMHALLEEGRLRVQPASFYRSITHNGAIRDDELAIGVSMAIGPEDLKALNNPASSRPGYADHRIDATLEFPSDYWLFCMAARFSSRLFVDFDADACVMIRDRDEFERRLLAAAKPTQLAHAKLTAAPVNYVDPVLPPGPSDILVPTAKHFRYSYQRETRFVWVPEKHMPCLQAIDLTLGNLADIADVVLI